MTIDVVWAACHCTCWPLTPLFGINRCGRCRERPIYHCDIPADGKAYEL